MARRTNKSTLEAHPFMDCVIEVWKNKSVSYAAGYLRGAASMNKTDKIYEELMFLSTLKKTIGESI